MEIRIAVRNVEGAFALGPYLLCLFVRDARCQSFSGRRSSLAWFNGESLPDCIRTSQIPLRVAWSAIKPVQSLTSTPKSGVPSKAKNHSPGMKVSLAKAKRSAVDAKQRATKVGGIPRSDAGPATPKAAAVARSTRRLFQQQRQCLLTAVPTANGPNLASPQANTESTVDHRPR